MVSITFPGGKKKLKGKTEMKKGKNEKQEKDDRINSVSTKRA